MTLATGGPNEYALWNHSKGRDNIRLCYNEQSRMKCTSTVRQKRSRCFPDCRERFAFEVIRVASGKSLPKIFSIMLKNIPA